MEGTVNLSVESYNRLRDENRRMKELVEKLKTENNNLIECDKKKVMCKIITKNRYFRFPGILNESVKEHTDITFVNLEDVEEELREKLEEEYNTTIEDLNHKNTQLRQRIDMLINRNLWQRIINAL